MVELLLVELGEGQALYPNPSAQPPVVWLIEVRLILEPWVRPWVLEQPWERGETAASSVQSLSE